jgi:hypothetical protein
MPEIVLLDKQGVSDKPKTGHHRSVESFGNYHDFGGALELLRPTASTWIASARTTWDAGAVPPLTSSMSSSACCRGAFTTRCFKWENPGGVQLPSQKVTRYTADHVLRLRNMVARQLPETAPLRVHHRRPARPGGCRDDPAVVPAPQPGRVLHRLRLFSDDMRELLGPRFIAMDLDCVVTGDLTPIFQRTEPFVINAYNTTERDQRYNGSMILMDAGARAKVWEYVRPGESAARDRRNTAP